MKLERITIDPAVCTGKPCIRGLRFPVSRLLGLLALGRNCGDTILTAYPYLEAADIGEALRYAAFLAGEGTGGGSCGGVSWSLSGGITCGYTGERGAKWTIA